MDKERKGKRDGGKMDCNEKTQLSEERMKAKAKIVLI